MASGEVTLAAPFPFYFISHVVMFTVIFVLDLP
jgi:hypothetical protein